MTEKTKKYGHCYKFIEEKTLSLERIPWYRKLFQFVDFMPFFDVILFIFFQIMTEIFMSILINVFLLFDV